MVRTVTFWSTLMGYAYELGQARLSGDQARIQAAQVRHDEYRDLCLRSDEMRLTVLTPGL